MLSLIDKVDITIISPEICSLSAPSIDQGLKTQVQVIVVDQNKNETVLTPHSSITITL
jgi:hypothetical protein